MAKKIQTYQLLLDARSGVGPTCILPPHLWARSCNFFKSQMLTDQHKQASTPLLLWWLSLLHAMDDYFSLQEYWVINQMWYIQIVVILYILDTNSWFTFYSIYSQCIGLPTAVSPPLANETGKQPDHLYPTNNVFLSWKYNKWICFWTNNVFLFCWKCNKWICTRPTTYFSPENEINVFVTNQQCISLLLKIHLWICNWPTTKDVSHEGNSAHIYNKWAQRETRCYACCSSSWLLSASSDHHNFRRPWGARLADRLWLRQF